MSSSLPPGEIIPGTRYRVRAKVAEGAMGAVYAAEHVDLEKPVALKTLLSEVAHSPEAVERLRAEARAASKIGSPFICDVTDFGELPAGEVFFVMEYLPGRSLAQVLDGDGPVDAARAIAILRQICKALGAAHDRGIVHLDVKPDNVMLLDSERRRDAVKVVDFGVAGLLAESGDEERIAGTPEYIAPERAVGKGYDNRTDIYALGVTAYEMLTGSVPFEAQDLVTALRRHVKEAPEPPSRRAPDRSIPPALESLIMQMLAKDPAQRPQRMDIVEAMLCEAQIAAKLRTEWDHLELPAVDEAWQRKLAARMPGRGPRRGLVLGALALAVVAAGLAIAIGLKKPREVVKIVHVAATKTEEPAAVATWLDKAEQAARRQRYIRPVDASALAFIERAEREARGLERNSPGAAALRRAYASALVGTGQELHRAGLTELAVVKFREALAFLPDDAELARRAELSEEERRAFKRTAGARTTGPGNGIHAVASDLFLAARKQRLSEARVEARKLATLDREGLVRARMADALRGLAATAWAKGDRDTGRSYYQLVLDLDPADLEAKTRMAIEPQPPFAPSPTPIASETRASGKGKADSRPYDAPEAPRDEGTARAAIAEGQAALRAGQLAQAEAAFSRGVRADPLNPAAVGGLAEVEFERARYTSALDYARRAARLAPQSPRYKVVLGDAYFKLLRYEEARAAYEQASALGRGKNQPDVTARLERVRAKLGTASD